MKRILPLIFFLVFVGCGSSDDGTITYTVGGTLSDLSGTVILQNSGADDLTLTADGSFTFTTGLADAATYAVTVSTQPDTQSCFVTNESGTISAANVTNVTVTCYASGSLDTSFGTGGVVTYDSGTGDSYGYTVAAGSVYISGSINNGTDRDMAIWKYDSDGNLDTSFNSTGIVTYDGGNGDDLGAHIVVDSSGNVIVAGYVESAAGNNQMALWRYTSTGVLDTTFNSSGVVIYSNDKGNDIGDDAVIDSSGKLVVTGNVDNGVDSDMAIWRYNTDGTADTTFSADGVVTYDYAAENDNGYGIVLDGSGNIIVSGAVKSGGNGYMTIWRYTSVGVLDTTFNLTGLVTYETNPDSYGASVAIDSSGNIITVGKLTDTNKIMAAWRYTSAGALDTTFNSTGVVTYSAGDGSSANCFKIDSAGKIYIVGTYTVDATPYSIIWKYNADGSLDTNFDTDGVVTYGDTSTEYAGYGLVFDSDGKIVVTGSGLNTNEDMVIWRYIQ